MLRKAKCWLQQWIQWFNSLAPSGYSARNTVARGVSDPGNPCFARHYGSRDYARCLYAIYVANRDGRLQLDVDASVSLFFSGLCLEHR